MGPKPKPKDKKPEVPEIDPAEIVTELEKEFFTFQLADIEKKLERITDRDLQLKAETLELESKIEEVKREQGAIVEEHQQILREKEEEKCSKREEMLFMSDEIKIHIEKHKQRIQELEQKHVETVMELTQRIQEAEEEIRILDDYKQGKDQYHAELDRLEQEMEEAEIQHQRNLFEINEKCEKAKMKVKKELQTRLLSLSIEFQETNKVRLGNPCHRVAQENKAVQTVLGIMKQEIRVFEEKYRNALKSMEKCRSTKNQKQEDKDKLIGRTLIQIYVIKNLRIQRMALLAKLKEFQAVENLNRSLQKKYADLVEQEQKMSEAIEDTSQRTALIIEETAKLTENDSHLKKSCRRFKLLVRNSLKIAEEALAVRLIPIGGLEEERYLTNDAKIALLKKRRDNTFVKKGKTLKYLFQFLSNAQPTEEEIQLLSEESVEMEAIDFGRIYGRPEAEKEVEEGLEEEAQKEQKGPVFYSSLTSLPRSVSQIITKAPSKEESVEGEFGEYGEYEEEGEDQKPTHFEYAGEGMEIMGEDYDEDEEEET